MNIISFIYFYQHVVTTLARLIANGAISITEIGVASREIALTCTQMTKQQYEIIRL